ncbi:MAG: cellulose biosynthesis cyclic di-GMP-binding regulatory protein BcsB [Succinivibrio sp.]|nr:cellulose biosynthesis cyclic di-GMP-binding regulatory protein BcsB [Succinivibrio sp.]
MSMRNHGKARGVLSLAVALWLPWVSQTVRADDPSILEELLAPDYDLGPADLMLPEDNPFSLSELPETQQSLDSVVSAPFAMQLTFGKLGAKHGILMRAGQNEAGLTFTMPVDKVVTSARLNLNLDISDEMAERNAHLDIFLNNQPVGTLPLTRVSGTASYELDLPFEFITTINDFDFKIADDQGFGCLIDNTRRFTVTILGDSTLNVEGHSISIDEDLSIFPMPFVDPFDVSKNTVQVVLPKSPGAGVLSAAAILASYLGFKADFRGVKFKVSLGALPERANAILIGKPGEDLGDIELPDTEGLYVQSHPGDPSYRLILIVAEGKQKLRNAVGTLISGTIPEKTKISPIKSQLFLPSEPYDAPRWIPTDRKVYLSELIDNRDDMISAGLWHPPINFNFRAAPDLYQFYGEPSDLYIRYSFPLEQWMDEPHSWLNVTLSGNYIRNLPVNKAGVLENLWRLAGGDGRKEDHHVQLQPYLIYGDNTLSLYFDIKLKQGAPCSLLHDRNIKSSIHEASYLDLSSTKHYAELPNLSFYVGASFPFTKYADFSDTIILLPDHPSATELQVMLDMAARAGTATGTPITNNRVALGLEGKDITHTEFANSNILAVSTLKHTDFYAKLLAGSAFRLTGEELEVKDLGPLSMEDGFFGALSRLMSGDFRPENLDAGRYIRSNVSWRGFVSFISPFRGDRIVVAVTANEDEQLDRLSDDLDNDEVNRSVGGDLTVISGDDSVRAFKVGNSIYSGDVSRMYSMLHFLGRHVFWMAMFSFVMLFAAGIFISRALKERSRRRLESGQI